MIELCLLLLLYGGVQQSPVAVLSITTGPHGAELNGTFRLDEERSRFDPSSDKEVVAFFQWQGSPGPHRLTVRWSSPDGGLSSNSALDYVASASRFGAYWSLPLTPSMPAGVWSVEATVDGQPGGRATFELTPMPMRAAAIVRRPLSTADLYAHLNAAFVVLDRQTRDGLHLDAGAAFTFGHGGLGTAVAALDGADVVDAVMPDGSKRRIESVQSLNRRQDWAILVTSPSSDVGLPIASTDATKVGDRCFSMEASASGGRTLTEGVVTGEVHAAGTGTRSLVQWRNGTGTPGAPVINEFGELVGVVGGTLVSGTASAADLLHFRAVLHAVPVVPASLLRPTPDAAGTPVADLQVRGDLLVATHRGEDIIVAGFTKRLQRDATSPSEQMEEFPASTALTAYVSWSPRTRLKGILSFRLVDENNRTVAESAAKKLDIRGGGFAFSRWDLTAPSAPGWYRGDFLIDGVPVHRAFLRVP